MESIEDRHRDRSLRNSDEAPVMEVERREAVIKFLVMDENWGRPQEVRK
jgi:hypothetical protein